MATNQSAQLESKIKQLRIAKGFSELDLAKQLGYDDSEIISVIEKGISRIPLEVICELVRLLEVPDDELSRLLTESFPNSSIMSRNHQMPEENK